MNKKSKIIVSLLMIVFIMILVLIGYTPGDSENINTSNEVSKIDIQIDDSKLNIFYFYVGQADCTLIMSEKTSNANRCGRKNRRRND